MSLDVIITRRPALDTEHSNGYLATVLARRGNLAQSPRFHLEWHHGNALPEPTAADILTHLAFEVGAYSESFDEWCADFGFDNDSIKALRAWEKSGHYVKSLRRVVGASGSDMASFLNEWSEQ